MIQHGITGRTLRGSVPHNRMERPSNKPRPTMDAGELLFNNLLSQGRRAIIENKSWLPFFLFCPVNRWYDLYCALKAAKMRHDKYSAKH